MKSLLEILAAVVGWAFGLWKRKNDPSTSQRHDRIAKDYDAKRNDLSRR